jgi:predicted TPR repeat methyltransferase
MTLVKQRAKQLIQANHLAEARRVLEAAGETSDAEASGLLGMVCGMIGDHLAAESALERAVALQPANAVLRNNLGCVLRLLGKHAQAGDQFREALRLRPNYTSAEVNLGCALIDTGKFTVAESVLRAALTTAPKNPEALNNLGTALRQMGRAAEATVCYEKAVQQRPDYPDALANLGMSRLFDNRLTDAEACLRQSLARAPGHISALYYLGFLLHKRNALSEAEQCFRRILEADPGHANAAYFLSVIGVREAPHQSPTEYVQELFDGYADNFDDHLVGALKYSAPEVMNRLVLQTLGEATPLLDILDLGCGTGLCAQKFTDIAKSIAGIDLSTRMLDKARMLGIYDHLVQADVTSFLVGQENTCDLILAGDVFIYIGDLSEVFSACARALRNGGLMSFSIERSDDERHYSLRTSGRYAQSPDYIAELAMASGLDVLALEDFVLREEYSSGIAGQVYVLAKGWGAE